VSSGIQFSWLAEVAWLGAVLLPLYLGVFWGLFGVYAATLGNPWRRPAAADRMLLPSLAAAAAHGAVWAGLEWLRGWLFTGFGWNGLGVAFHRTPVLAQAADLLGVAGLSLLLVFFQAVLVQAARRLWDGLRDGRRRPRWDFIAAVAVVAAVIGYGLITSAAERRRESVRLKALLVQLNIPQAAARMQWDDLTIHRSYEDDTLAALEKLTQEDEQALQQALGQDTEGQVRLRWPDWVIWPESAMRGRILRADDGAWGAWQGNLDTLATVRTGGTFNLIYGAIELQALPNAAGDLVPKPDGAMFNSLIAMDPDDELQSYRKHHLVIFGETIPFMETLPFLKAIYEQQSGAEYLASFTSGTSFEPLRLLAGGTEVGVIPSVCFEDTVPRLARRFVRGGPQVIVNVTNDGWFHESAAAAQHFANARFRAIELRRPMLRCANTGVSAAIDSTGGTQHPDNPRVSQVLTDDHGSHFTRKAQLVELNVPLRPATTLYSVTGDAGIIALALLALAAGALSRLKTRGQSSHGNIPEHQSP
jgi:apolipoprotein N-acyltransferase